MAPNHTCHIDLLLLSHSQLMDSPIHPYTTLAPTWQILKTESSFTSIDVSVTSTARRMVLKRFIKMGIQIAPDALDYIMALDSPSEAVDTLMEQTYPSSRPSVVSREYIESVLENRPLQSEYLGPPQLGSASQNQPIQTAEPEMTSSSEEPDNLIHDIVIVKNPDKIEVASAGTVDDFLALFTDRFLRIKRIYMKRIDTRDALTLEVAKQQARTARREKLISREGGRTRRSPNLKVIGIIKNKSISRSKNIIIEIEDDTTSIICVIPTGRHGVKGQQLVEKGNALLLDEIVCVSGRLDQDHRMIADDIIYPEIPTARDVGRAKRDVYAAFISDLHCGSLEFLDDEFDRFINWARGVDCTESDKQIVENLRYLFIAGDLVDGVGVYPTQHENLAITSIYDQYAHLAKKLRRLPQNIKIICIPGNHDAVRQALPKPPIPEEFAPSMYALGDRVLMLGDPCYIKVEGVGILMNHGDSLDDLVTNIPSASYTDPATPMKDLLRKRHLVPLYGGKTELAPLSRDWMVIDTPPDVVHFGHAHHYAIDNYRGVQIINSGTFQGQTEFMRKQGIDPTPGMVTLLNLRTGAPDMRFFFDVEKIRTNS